MLNSFTLLSALQRFLDERRVAVEMLTVDPAVALMLDWYRLAPVDVAAKTATADVLVFRYGGWSEGCATGYKLSLLRRVTEASAQGETDWLAGISLLFEPSGLTGLQPYHTVSGEWKSLDAFLEAIQASPGFKKLATERPMGVLLESGGLR